VDGLSDSEDESSEGTTEFEKRSLLPENKNMRRRIPFTNKHSRWTYNTMNGRRSWCDKNLSQGHPKFIIIHPPNLKVTKQWIENGILIFGYFKIMVPRLISETHLWVRPRMRYGVFLFVTLYLLIVKWSPFSE
jgi:hypothetical protein